MNHRTIWWDDISQQWIGYDFETKTFHEFKRYTQAWLWKHIDRQLVNLGGGNEAEEVEGVARDE